MRLAARASAPVLDGITLVACAGCAGALAVTAPVWAGAATAVVACTLAIVRARSPAFGERPWITRFVALACAVAFAVSAWRASRVIASHRAARAILGPPTGSSVVSPAPWPARCEGAGRVVRSPTFSSGVVRVELDVVALAACSPERDGRGVPARGRIRLSAAPEIGAELRRGDDVHFVAQLAPVPVYRNPGAGDAAAAAWAMVARREVVLSGTALDVVLVARAPPSRASYVLALSDRARAHVRLRIAATFPPSTEAMARALVLGEDDVDDADRRAFQASGLSHLLAVSGMHLVVVIASLVHAARAVLVRVPAIASRVEPGRVASAIGVPLAFFYADLAGGSGSASRAAIMTATALLARAVARRASAWRALGWSVLVTLAFDPLAPFDVSFALSVTATLGLLVMARPVDRALAPRLPKVLAWTRGPAAATVGASVACAPILAWMSPELPLASLLANVLAVPVGEVVALPLCLAHTLLGALPDAERGCALAGGGALALVRVIARGAAAVPGGGLPVPPLTAFQAASLATCAVLAAMRVVRGRSALLAVITLVVAGEGHARAEAAPRGVLRVTFLDVGQGDAALVDLPDGSAILVDGGGVVGSPFDVGERLLAPVLRARRRSELAAVVLSHPHPDHFLGLASGLARVPARAFWDTGQGEAEGAHEGPSAHAAATFGPYGELLARMRAGGVPVLHAEELCGERVVGGARIEVLAPCPSWSAERGPNDNSFVFRVTYGARRVLFVGDAEHALEADLLASARDRLRSDVLKVGHHGSRTSSTPAFVAAVAPRVAVVSSGVRNRFGHPHGETIRTLARAGVTTLRTDVDGAVTVTTDGETLEVATAERGVVDADEAFSSVRRRR